MSNTYVNYIKRMLKKYKVDSPKQLSDGARKKFFKEVDKGWESKEEKKEKVKKAVLEIIKSKKKL